MPRDALKRLVSGEHLTAEDAERVIDALMEGAAPPALAGAILAALAAKGETVEEITAFARGMRRRVTRIPSQAGPLLDTCGTGGGAFKTFNVSTASAFVACAAGAVVAKHGNRAMTGVCGSADVLEKLGVRITLTPEQTARCIEELGIGFLFAQSHHPAMRHVAPVRRELGIRTIFNLLGPLSNPAGATLQVTGVYDPALVPLVARALQQLGATRAAALHAYIGTDEISTVGRTAVSELADGEIRDYEITPADLGITSPEPDLDLLKAASTADENAEMLREALTPGNDGPGATARRDMVAANAAAGLRVWSGSTDWASSYRQAHVVIASGRPLEILHRLAALTQSFEA